MILLGMVMVAMIKLSMRTAQSVAAKGVRPLRSMAVSSARWMFSGVLRGTRSCICRVRSSGVAFRH